jgi:Holliday junction resolvase-like predicted endonuclease
MRTQDLSAKPVVTIANDSPHADRLMIQGGNMPNPQPPVNNPLPFDGIRHEDDQGEYWLARELGAVLEYALWQNFERVIKKAMKAAEGSGQQASDHFININKMVTLGSGATRRVQDYRLTRYACYLIAQNGDPEKPVIAMAQTYFAVQTRRQELADAGTLDDLERTYQDWRNRAIRSYVARGYDEDWARMRVDGITVRNQLTAEWVVRDISSKEFAILTDELHMGSFGLSTEEHKEMKGFPVVRRGKRMAHDGDLRDAMGVMELAVTQVGEIMARALHIARDSHGIKEIRRDVEHAGIYAADRRKELMKLSGQQIPTSLNAIPQSNTLWDQLPPEPKQPPLDAPERQNESLPLTTKDDSQSSK